MVSKAKIKQEEVDGYKIEMIDPYDIVSIWIYEEDEKEKEVLRKYLREKYGINPTSIFGIKEWVDFVRETYKVHPRIEIALSYRKLLRCDMIGDGAMLYKVGEGVYVCYP